MSKKKKLTLEELIIEEFNKYGISTKLRAIICLIEKITYKNNIQKQVLNKIKQVQTLQDLESLIVDVCRREIQLRPYLVNEKIDLEEQIEKEIKMQVIKLGIRTIKNIIETILEINMDVEILKAVYSKINDNIHTSNAVQKIIAELTKKWKFNTFIDMFVGRADLAINIIKNHNQVKLIGNDINIDELFFAIINLYIQDGLEWELRCKNSITDYDIYSESKYDLIVSEIPILQIVNLEEMQQLRGEFEFGMSKMYLDYYAIQRILIKLSPKGKAIVVVPNSTLFRVGLDQCVRKAIIQRDLVEAVITLPRKIYKNTMLQTNILILNKLKEKDRKNKIQFINASEMYCKENGRNVVSQENVEEIVNLYENKINNKTTSLLLTCEQMHQYDYSLYIWNKYINEIENQDIKGHLLLKDVAKVIRGIQITKERYEQAKENGKTHYYITASDIDNQTGKINVNDETLMKPENRWIEKCQVQEGDVIITMKGTSLKIGIANNLPQSIISGNLMIIRTEGKYDPYVLKTYFESPEGSKIIKSIQRGTSISIINPEDLENVIIPNLNIEQQRDIKNRIIESEKNYLQSMKVIETKRLQEKSEIYKKMGLGGI